MSNLLEVLLSDSHIGYLSQDEAANCSFRFSQSYIDMGPSRPTLSLSFMVPGDEEQTIRLFLDQEHTGSAPHCLPAFFANLLPEGAWREFVCAQRHIEADDFALISALGENLPGAICIRPTEQDPADDSNAIKYTLKDIEEGETSTQPAEDWLNYALAGEGIKLLLVPEQTRFRLPKDDEFATHTIKLPPPDMAHFAENEFAMHKMAQKIGITTVPIQLIDSSSLPLEQLPGLEDFPAGKVVAIERFDRGADGHQRIHVEDFAQALNVLPAAKAAGPDYEILACLIKEQFVDSTHNIEQFLRRLVFNVLIGNAHGHLKNWGIIYHDGCLPELAPAYNLISTLPYGGQPNTALALADIKQFTDYSEQVFATFAANCELPEKFVIKTVHDAVAKAAASWPNLLDELALPEEIYWALVSHWEAIADNF